MYTPFVLLMVVYAVSAVPKNAGRIVGGSLTTIDQYPFQAAILWTNDLVWYQYICGSTILNSRSILTAAHCFTDIVSIRYRIRVGSSFANSGGAVHNTAQIFPHPSYDTWTQDSDIAIVHSATAFVYNNNVQPGFIAGTNYNLADNQEVWATGWGDTRVDGWSEQLRHVQIWTINQELCNEIYSFLGGLTDNMMCSGWLGVGGKDQCSGDSGGPLIHNGVVVGVCSWGGCADPRYPGVNVRVSRYTAWITALA